MQAKPRVRPENFNSFWSTATGWGTFSQLMHENRLKFTLTVKAGTLLARTVTLSKPGKVVAKSQTTVGKTQIAHQARRAGSEVVVTLASDVNLTENDQLVLMV